MSLTRICSMSLMKSIMTSAGSRACVLSAEPIANNKPMVTWVDRLKRWQSGSQTETGTKQSQPEGEAVASAEHKSDSKSVSGNQSADSKSEDTASVDNANLLKEKEEVVQQQAGKIKELEDKYMRALAEIENTRKRMMEKVEDARQFGIQGFSRDILDVADVLEKATDSVPESELKKGVNPPLLSLFEGIKMTEEQLRKVFTKNGLKRIEALGEKFDPVLHEAVFQVPGDKPGTVAVVSKVGYLLNGRTIRPALVGVAKAKSTS